jgi:hypothetical protein
MTLTQLEENEAPPAAFAHLCAVYDAMKAEAVRTEEGLVYEGFMTKLVLERLRLAIPYYTTVTQALKGMDCAQQLKRGGSSSASRWVLKDEPTLEAYKKWEVVRDSAKRSPSTSKSAVHTQMLQDHEGRISTLEASFAELLEALKDND